MGTQSGTILRLQLGDKETGKPQGKLKIISGAAHSNLQVLKVIQLFLLPSPLGSTLFPYGFCCHCIRHKIPRVCSRAYSNSKTTTFFHFLKVTNRVIYVDDGNTAYWDKAYLKSDMEAQHSGSKVRSVSCCNYAYGQVEVLKSGPSNRGVLLVSQQQQSGMSYLAENYSRFKPKMEAVGKMVFVVEEELDFDKK